MDGCDVKIYTKVDKNGLGYNVVIFLEVETVCSLQEHGLAWIRQKMDKAWILCGLIIMEIDQSCWLITALYVYFKIHVNTNESANYVL